MPSARHAASSPKEKPRSEGEKFALALGLENQLDTFQQFKHHFRRFANETFNLNLPLFQQTQNMNTFTEKVVKAFPGSFDPDIENHQERINRLQHYARSYLDKSGKMSTSARSSTQGKFPKPRSFKLAEAPAPPSPPKKPNNSTTPNLKSAMKLTTVVDQPMSDAPPLNKVIKAVRSTPNFKKSAMKTKIAIDEPMSDAPPLDTVSRPPSRQAVHPRSRKTSLVDEPMLDAPPLETPTLAPGPNKSRSAPTTPASKPSRAPGPNKPSHAAPVRATQAASKSTTQPSPLVAVLAEFHPPMDHCAPAFERAGVTRAAELGALRHWDDSRLRGFLTTRNNIARTPLEEEALIIGLHSLS